MRENNRVVVADYNRVLRSEAFETAEAAYQAYTNIIDDLRNTLKCFDRVMVMRYRWGRIMTMEEIQGVK